MIAIGCLAPLILGVIGGLLGYWMAGADNAPWGFAGGFVIGALFLGTIAWLMARAKS
ncbi:hypothetical protein [Amorphus orientalis]|uniref:Uncharacterized membrane protein (UPF0136 family) n=1 Tax=Amorphus orientalis TaxID=649198 RepID=A0AAE3VNY2_9HYPH|nr:hypothetical protein [Amorphus orientalis]MDQ0315526.1 uncharacterized membrane protein (UPF0136 family) [Amorphus orientalis]